MKDRKVVIVGRSILAFSRMDDGTRMRRDISDISRISVEIISTARMHASIKMSSRERRAKLPTRESPPLTVPLFFPPAYGKTSRISRRDRGGERASFLSVGFLRGYARGCNARCWPKARSRCNEARYIRPRLSPAPSSFCRRCLPLSLSFLAAFLFLHLPWGGIVS